MHWVMSVTAGLALALLAEGTELLSACSFSRPRTSGRSYNFDLKYIQGPQNAVADALSHDPFATSACRHLIQEPYNNLVKEAESAKVDRVQDDFRHGIRRLPVAQKMDPFLALRVPVIFQRSELLC